MNAYHNGDTPEASMFYGQEMSLVDNYDEKVHKDNLIIKTEPFPEFYHTFLAIIRSGRFGESGMKAEFWDIIFGKRNESGNWY